jgi:hypothetical protein
MRQCTICGSQAEQHMCGGTPTLPPYDGPSEEIRNLRAGLESLQRSHMQDMEMAIEQRDKAYSELDAMKLQIGEMKEFAGHHSTCLGNICRFDGSHKCHEVILAQMKGYTEKPKSAEGVCPHCYHNYNDPAGQCPDHAEKRIEPSPKERSSILEDCPCGVPHVKKGLPVNANGHSANCGCGMCF